MRPVFKEQAKATEPANLPTIKSLDENWCDKDVVMLHACFQLLEDCVHDENLFNGHVNWDHNDELRPARAELQELYDWWQERKVRTFEEDSGELDRSVFEEDTRRLHASIELRYLLRA